MRTDVVCAYISTRSPAAERHGGEKARRVSDRSKRGWSIHYMESDDLYMDNEIPKARMQFLEVKENPKKWFKLDLQ